MILNFLKKKKKLFVCPQCEHQKLYKWRVELNSIIDKMCLWSEGRAYYCKKCGYNKIELEEGEPINFVSGVKKGNPIFKETEWAKNNVFSAKEVADSIKKQLCN